MPILIALFAVAAFVVGVVYAFEFLAARLGEPAAVCISIVAMLAIAALVVRWIQRRREIASNSKEGNWTHVLVQSWGGIRLSATKGFLWLSLDGAQGEYTLTDLAECTASEVDGIWYVRLRVRDTNRADWHLPMPSRQEAGRWARILTLAQTQRL
jgi:hypothetical protein